MSATVTIPQRGTDLLTETITVQKAESYVIDEDTGYLHLRTSTWGGDNIAVFKEWLHVVIEPNRGPNGKFVKKGRG